MDIILVGNWYSKAKCGYLVYEYVPELVGLAGKLGLYEFGDEVDEMELERRVINRMTLLCNGLYIPYGRVELRYSLGEDKFSYGTKVDARALREMLDLSWIGDKPTIEDTGLLNALLEYRVGLLEGHWIIVWLSVLNRRVLMSWVDRVLWLLVWVALLIVLSV